MTVPLASRSPALELDNVTKLFGAYSAVAGLSLRVEAGEFVSLVGPSGCGKTTLLRMIAGLEAPTSGSISIGGTDVSRAPPYQRNIGLVFQHYALFPHKTVAANIDFGLRHRLRLPADERAEAIYQALALVRLEGYGDRKPGQLSGGQQQRVALARAIVTKPELLLLDEPLSNLDAKLRDEMRVELKELHDRVGITFVYVTHDRIEAISMSDRVVVLRGGRIDQVASPREIFEEPQSSHVARFMGHENLLSGTVERRADSPTQVKLDIGPVVPARVPAAIRDGERVLLLVRANGASLEAETGSKDESAAITGRLRSLLYQGLRVEAYVDLYDGAQLRLEIPTHQTSALKPNQPVTVRVLTAGTWVIKEE